MNRNLLLTTIVFIAIVVYLLFFHERTIMNVAERNMCKAKDQALKVKLSGILLSKYEDENDHLVKKVEIKTNNGITTSSFLASEMSGFYDKIQVGDSIIKKRGILDIIVYKNAKSSSYHLNYSCQE